MKIKSGILSISKREAKGINLLLDHVQKELDLNDWQNDRPDKLDINTALKIMEARNILINFTNPNK